MKVHRIPLYCMFLFWSHMAYSSCVCVAGQIGNECRASSIETYTADKRTIRISWQFSQQHPFPYCGLFANGDVWVAPYIPGNSVVLESVSADYFISDRETESQPKAQLYQAEVFVDENPQLESNGFLGNTNNYGSFNKQENLAWQLPISLSKTTSLVAAVKKDESLFGNCGTSAIEGNCVDLYQVITFLDRLPENEGSRILRPSIDEDEKDLMRLDDFDFTHLPSLDYIEPITAGEVQLIRQRWSHSLENFSIKSSDGMVFSEGGRAYRADALIDDYAAGTAQLFYNDFFSLLSAENTLEEVLPALTAMIVYGKEIYFAIYDNRVKTRSWGSGAGQHLGKFAPAVLFATFHRNNTYSNDLKYSTLLTGRRGVEAPQELEQINLTPHGPVWGDFPDVMTMGEVNRYWGELFKAQCYDGAAGPCNPNRGKKTTRDPYNLIDGPPTSPGLFYMSVTAGPMQSIVAMSHLMPKFCETVNHPFLIAYVDRILSRGTQTTNDVCAPPDPREDLESCDPFRAQGCEYYGLSNNGDSTWGPKSEEELQVCIPINTGGNSNQLGRYFSQRESEVNIGFKSILVHSNWDLIRNSETPCPNTDEIFHSDFEED